MIVQIVFSLVTQAHAQTAACDRYLELAIDAARTGIELSRAALATGDFARETKSDGSLVTDADLAVSRELARILGEGSGLPVFSEESPAPPLDRLMTWPRVWVIDPIDGTENFARSGSDFSVLIALLERDANGVARPVIGVIGRPAENQIHHGALGRGSWTIDLSRPARPAERLLAARPGPGVPRATMQKPTQALLAGGALKNRLIFDRVGGNGAKFIAMAGGRVDLYFAQPMKWWDIAAGDALYRYAVHDGEDPRPSPLIYQTHPGSIVYYQERGFILGDAPLDDEVRREVMAALTRGR